MSTLSEDSTLRALLVVFRTLDTFRLEEFIYFLPNCGPLFMQP